LVAILPVSLLFTGAAVLAAWAIERRNLPRAPLVALESNAGEFAVRLDLAPEPIVGYPSAYRLHLFDGNRQRPSPVPSTLPSQAATAISVRRKP